MKIARAEHKNEIFYCVLRGNDAYPIIGRPYDGIAEDGRRFPVKDIRLLAPAEPSKIVAVGLNYKSHAQELKIELPDEPVLFIKPSTSVIGPFDEIIYPKSSKRMDYEAELAVVMGKICRNAPEDKAHEYIFGYTCLNDVTARDLQKKDGQWTRSKSFDTFCPMGPHIETDYDWKNKRVQSILNGETRQDSTTGSFICGVFALVSYISNVLTLLPGDVIATGTPEGIGPMQKGDKIEIKVEGIGTLENTVGKK